MNIDTKLQYLSELRQLLSSPVQPKVTMDGYAGVVSSSDKEEIHERIKRVCESIESDLEVQKEITVSKIVVKISEDQEKALKALRQCEFKVMR